MPPITILLYREDDGTVPMLGWLDTLPSKVVAKCRVKIERLRELGHELRRPEADFLRDGIHELRVGYQGQNYRMLYFFHRNFAVVLSHGLMKERSVPPSEIDRALERKKRFESNPRKHTHED